MEAVAVELGGPAVDGKSRSFWRRRSEERREVEGMEASSEGRHCSELRGDEEEFFDLEMRSADTGFWALRGDFILHPEF